MKKIISTTQEGNLVHVVVQYDMGTISNIDMTKNEYQAFLLKEKMIDLGVHEIDLNQLEKLAFERGYDAGWDDRG